MEYQMDRKIIHAMRKFVFLDKKQAFLLHILKIFVTFA